METIDVDGVGVVLRRLTITGCDPERFGTGTWNAHCPVHRGPYRALVVNCGADGRVSLRCRYVGARGESCTQADIWKSLALRPQPLESTVATTAQSVAEVEQGAGAQREFAVEAASPAPDGSGQHATAVAEAPEGSDRASVGAAPAPGRAPVATANRTRD